MIDWRDQMEAALTDFRRVADLAGAPLGDRELTAEFLPAPHKAPSLPRGKMAVYSFWRDGEWLKIGKVGPNSDARYRSQHYEIGRAASSLANSIANDPAFCADSGFTRDRCADWTKANTHRCNILLPAEKPKALLSLLEAFLHQRLKPRFEG